MTVYRIPTHTDQHLHWESHNNLSVKYSMFNTLTHRATSVLTLTATKGGGAYEEGLQRCNDHKWALGRYL